MIRALRTTAVVCAAVPLFFSCSGTSASKDSDTAFCGAITVFDDSLKNVSDLMGEDPNVDEFRSEFAKLVNATKDLAGTAVADLKDEADLIRKSIAEFSAVMEKFDYDVFAVATSSVAMKQLEVVASEEFVAASEAVTGYSTNNCN